MIQRFLNKTITIPLMSKISVLEYMARKSHDGVTPRKSDHEMHNRGLYDNPSYEHANVGYKSALQFDFEGYVKAAAKKPLIVADIGCGMARFLYDLKCTDGLIEVFGIDHFLYESYIDPSHFMVGEVPNEDHMTDFLDRLPEAVFDMITSTNCLEPLNAEISLAQVRQINRITSREGFARIQIPDSFWNEEIYHASLKEGVRMTQMKVEHLGPQYHESCRVITIMGENWKHPTYCESTRTVFS